MAHTHGHSHAETRNLRVAFFLNLGFTLVELVGGFLTNSVAILTDAVHDLGDSCSLGLSWYFQHLSNKNPTRKFTYGYRRYSVVGALVNTVVLLVGSVIMLYEAIPRIWDPQQAHAPGMIGLAVLGIVINGLAVLRLRKGNSINERAVMLHLLEDVLGWIAVLIGAILIYFFNWIVLDPILSIAISVFILFNIYRNLRSVMGVLLQRVPDGMDVAQLENFLGNTPGVKEFHDLHVWTLDGTYHVLTVHLQVKNELTPKAQHDLKKKIREGLTGFDVHHATIELDPPGFPCEFSDEEALH